MKFDSKHVLKINQYSNFQNTLNKKLLNGCLVPHKITSNLFYVVVSDHDSDKISLIICHRKVDQDFHNKYHNIFIFDDGNDILTDLEYCINEGIDINTLSDNTVADFAFTKKFSNGETDERIDNLFYNLNKASYGGYALFCNFMSKLARS